MCLIDINTQFRPKTRTTPLIGLATIKLTTQLLLNWVAKKVDQHAFRAANEYNSRCSHHLWRL